MLFAAWIVGLLEATKAGVFVCLTRDLDFFTAMKLICTPRGLTSSAARVLYIGT